MILAIGNASIISYRFPKNSNHEVVAVKATTKLEVSTKIAMMVVEVEGTVAALVGVGVIKGEDVEPASVEVDKDFDYFLRYSYIGNKIANVIADTKMS